MEDRSRNGDDAVHEKVRAKDRYEKNQHHHHLRLDYGNDKAFLIRSSSNKFGRSHGDSLARRFLVWRSLIYTCIFFCSLFVANQFIDLFHPDAERLLIQAHHNQQFLPVSNAVEYHQRYPPTSNAAENHQESLPISNAAQHHQKSLPISKPAQHYPKPVPVSNAADERFVGEAKSLLVQDFVTLPENVLLFLKTCDGCSLLQKNDYECVYGGGKGRTYRTSVISVDIKAQDLQIVRCQHPPRPKFAQGLSLTINLKELGMLVPSKVQYSNKFRWRMLTYEAVAEENSVLLFVKGLNLRRGKISSTDNLLCVFGSDLDSLQYVRDLRRWERRVSKTKVIMASQEVIRCEKPKDFELQKSQGMKVSVWEFRRGLLPSVARLNDKTINTTEKNSRPMHKVCACTMLWNQAAFLREWIMYHGYLGIQKWFLYDNNSDDNIDEVVDSLGFFNVSKHIWPWIKSQEAGFSHCALRARQECEWVAFMDVDEFLNPIGYIQNGTRPIDFSETGPSVMQRLIDNATSADKRVYRTGEIRIDCHSFGPSGLKKHPAEGVIAGYTCRLNRTERHKSIVRTSALNPSLLNLVHHFHLKRGYRSRSLRKRFAVFNHYKYQVWDTFKAKFFRRVATYVTDWQENENEGSNDRAPGLGTEPIEPPDWSERFCEVSDTLLRNFTIKTLTDPTTLLLPWQ
uniref:Glycosyltransferase family 92 protein n=1 Tax=Araucaria cunninghamii TaxID=56994 RepID=A0A0D6RB98_ARACU